MVNISLKEIAKFDDNAQDISLKDLETSFDNLIKKEKDINKFVSKTLVPKLEKNLEQYNFNSENIQTEILEKLKNEKFSDISKNINTIKVYQLCQALQNKNANITIDGILWESMVNDLVNNRLQFYQEGWLWLLDWESISYERNKLLINTWFWDVEVSYDSNKDTLFEILETKENLVKFINEKKEELFQPFFKEECTEFTISINKDSNNAKVDSNNAKVDSDNATIDSDNATIDGDNATIDSDNATVDGNNATVDDDNTIVNVNDYIANTKESIKYVDWKIYIDFINENNWLLNKSYFYEITPDILKSDLSEYIWKTREEYREFLSEEAEYQSFLLESELKLWILEKFKDPYKNIEEILWKDQFEEFKDQLEEFQKAKFFLNSITWDNIQYLEINDEWKLVIGDTQILWYTFENLDADKRYFLATNIKIILEEFIKYFPNSTDRLNKGNISDIKKNIDYEKNVHVILSELQTKENVDKLKKGELDLWDWEKKKGAVYLKKAFNYWISELNDQWISVKEITEWRDIKKSKTFLFMNSKINSNDRREMLYESLYYECIKNKLWWLLVVNEADGNRSLDGSKLNFSPNKNYKRLIYEEEASKTDDGMKEIINNNALLKNLTPVQKEVLYDTQIWFNLLKTTVVNLEIAKYESLTKDFANAEKQYRNRTAYIYSNVHQAQLALTHPIIYPAGSDPTAIRYKLIQKLTSDQKKYADYNYHTQEYSMKESLIKEEIAQEQKRINELWVTHALELHKFWLTKYTEWETWTWTANLYEAIEGRKQVMSPFYDGYCHMKLDFSYIDSKDMVRDTTWEKLKDRTDEKIKAFKEDKIGFVAKWLIDITWIIVWWVVAAIVTPIAWPVAWWWAFFLVDNAWKAKFYGELEVINYLRWKGAGDYDNILEARYYGSLMWLWVVEIDTNVWLESNYKKDEQGKLVIKKGWTILTEKILELWAAMILFGPVGKAGHMVERGVYNNFVRKYSVETFWKNTVTKLFWKEVTNLWAKTASKSLWFFAEVCAFTWFNTVYSPFSSWVVTLVETWKFDEARAQASAAREQSISSVWLITNFVHNVWFIGLLKWAWFLANPITSRITTTAEMARYNNIKDKTFKLENELNIEMGKKNLKVLSNEKIAEFEKSGVEIIGKDNIPEGEWWWVFRETTNWTKKSFEFVPKSEAKTVYDINNQITKLRGEFILLTQALSTKLEETNKIDAIREYNEFIEANNLKWMEVPPEVMLEQQIKYC